MTKRGGFTLMELMIVIALVMILSVIGIGSFTLATVKSKDTQRKNDLSQISKAIESFSADIGRYPLSLEGENFMHCYIKDGSVAIDQVCDGEKLYSVIDGAMTVYIPIPSDPDPASEYVYISDGSSYAIYAALENTADKDLLRDSEENVVLDPWGIDCGSVKCNYQVTETGLTKSYDEE